MLNKALLDRLAIITEEEEKILEGEKIIEKGLYTSTEELVVQKEKFLQKGKSIGVRSHTRFAHFPEHKHNYVEVIYVCQGVLTHIVNGTMIEVKEGELLLLNQNVVQEVMPARETDIAINFIIDPHFFDTPVMMLGKEDSLLKQFLVSSLTRNVTSASYLYFQVSEVLGIQNLMENMIDSLVNREPNKRSINQVTLGLIFLHLMNHIDKVKYEEWSIEKTLMMRVNHYIEENYQRESLTELAEELHYDLCWISRAIKKYTGKTYKQLLQEKRMNRTIYLLLHTELSIDDIIHTVGYTNKSYFYKVFYKWYEMTPYAYRKTYK